MLVENQQIPIKQFLISLHGINKKQTLSLSNQKPGNAVKVHQIENHCILPHDTINGA